MNDGWSKLAAPYFVPTCQAVMDAYFVSQEFTEREISSFTSVSYSRLGVLVNIGYELETSPNYSPRVSIGFAQGGSIALGRVIPKDSVERQYWNWRFTCQEDAEKILSRIRDRVIDTYGRPLWESPGSLKPFIEQQTEETAARL